MKAYITAVEEACYDEPHMSILDDTVFKSKKSAQKALVAKYEKWKKEHPAIEKNCLGTVDSLSPNKVYAYLRDHGEYIELIVKEMKFVS